MASESSYLLRRIWSLRKLYNLVIILNMKNDVSTCNISIEWKIGRLHGCIKTTILHNLINHNTNLNDHWLRTLDHNSFQACWKLSESKTFNNYIFNIIINIQRVGERGGGAHRKEKKINYYPNIIINTFWSK